MRRIGSAGGSVVPPFWALTAAATAVVLVAATSAGRQLPMVAVSAAAFAAGQALFPCCRVRRTSLLGPLNWAVFLFFLQLVVLPTSVLVFGASQGTLPNMPSVRAINIALLVSTLAYAAFCLAAQVATSPMYKQPPRRGSHRRLSDLQYVRLAVACAVLGMSGFYLAFGGPGGMLEFFTDPSTFLVEASTRAGSVRHFAGIVLRPFLGFAAVMMWCYWVDHEGHREGRARRMITTGACLAVVAVVGLSFSFNRAGALVPMIAIAAVYSARIARVRLLSLVAAAALTYPIAVAIGTYRSGGLSADQVLDEATLVKLGIESHNWIGTVQVYGAAPQFMGFMLERGRYGQNLYWGETLLSSVMYPLPIVGRPFRATSGVVLYNEMIYGSSGFLDQNVPFQGELFLNFHVAGVLAAFALLGWLTVRLQSRFDTARHPLEQYILMVVVIWVLFLVQGGLSVVSQIFIYFFWPVYLFLVWQRFRGGFIETASNRRPAQLSGVVRRAHT